MEIDPEQILFFTTSIILILAAIYLIKTAKNHRETPIYNPNYNYNTRKQYTPLPHYTTHVNPPVNTDIVKPIQQIQAPSQRTIRLEIEFPELPETIRIPLEKLPKLLEVIKEGREEEAGMGREMHHKIVVQGESEEERAKERKSWSALRRHDNPLLDILERVSGLEFSEDGERVYCPRHGWVHYIIASDGRIICGEGHENLWDPNKDRFIPPSKKEMERLQRELMNIRREIEDLQRQAELRPTEAPRKKTEKEIGEDYEEEYEEPGEEETEA